MVIVIDLTASSPAPAQRQARRKTPVVCPGYGEMAHWGQTDNSLERVCGRVRETVSALPPALIDVDVERWLRAMER